MYDDRLDYYDFLTKNGILIFTENRDTVINDDVFNENVDWKKHSDDYLRNGYSVIDDVLKLEYLERLRKFVLYLNVRQDKYRNYAAVNYSKRKGDIWFSLMEKISDGLKERLKFLNDLNYQRSWSFIYESEAIGPTPHYDPGSIITTNLWVTPNECMNLKPNYNGIEIWNVFYSNASNENKYDPDLLKNVIEKIKEPSAKKISIGYKNNRMMFFNSGLIHRSQPISSKPGYENRKINFTFLYK